MGKRISSAAREENEEKQEKSFSVQGWEKMFDIEKKITHIMIYEHLQNGLIAICSANRG